MNDLRQKAADNISSRVNEFVTENGRTIESIANEIGCSRTAFYQKLHGNSNFTLSEGYKLSKLLGCEVAAFFS